MILWLIGSSWRLTKPLLTAPVGPYGTAMRRIRCCFVISGQDVILKESSLDAKSLGVTKIRTSTVVGIGFVSLESQEIEQSRHRVDHFIIFEEKTDHKSLNVMFTYMFLGLWSVYTLNACDHCMVHLGKRRSVADWADFERLLCSIYFSNNY